MGAGGDGSFMFHNVWGLTWENSKTRGEWTAAGCKSIFTVMSSGWCGTFPCGLVELLARRSLDSKSYGTQRARKVCGILWSSLGIPMALLYWSRGLPRSGRVDAAPGWEEYHGHVLRKACGMGDTVTLSLETSGPQVIICYCHLFGTHIVPYLACGNFFKLTSFEYFWHVSPFSEQLLYFLAEDILGSFCLFCAPALKLAIFPRSPASF